MVVNTTAIDVEWIEPVEADIDLTFSFWVCDALAAVFEDLDEMEEKIARKIENSIRDGIQSNLPTEMGVIVDEIVHKEGEIYFHLLDWNAVTINVPYLNENPTSSWETGLRYAMR